MENVRNGSALQSFVSEHTLEYHLVGSLLGLLGAQGISAVPLYFWSSREGSKLSMTIHAEWSGRLCAVFPRRPKFDRRRRHCVFAKFNAELFDYARQSRQVGVQTLAALPIIESLSDLLHAPEVAWFALDEGTADVVVQLETAGELDESAADGVRRLDPSEIVARVLEGSWRVSWQEATRAMRELRKCVASSNFYLSGGYKPVYFFLAEPEPFSSCS